MLPILLGLFVALLVAMVLAASGLLAPRPAGPTDRAPKAPWGLRSIAPDLHESFNNSTVGLGFCGIGTGVGAAVQHEGHRAWWFLGLTLAAPVIFALARIVGRAYYRDRVPQVRPANMGWWLPVGVGIGITLKVLVDVLDAWDIALLIVYVLCFYGLGHILAMYQRDALVRRQTEGATGV